MGAEENLALVLLKPAVVSSLVLCRCYSRFTRLSTRLPEVLEELMS